MKKGKSREEGVESEGGEKTEEEEECHNRGKREKERKRWLREESE